MWDKERSDEDGKRIDKGEDGFTKGLRVFNVPRTTLKAQQWAEDLAVLSLERKSVDVRPYGAEKKVN